MTDLARPVLAMAMSLRATIPDISQQALRERLVSCLKELERESAAAGLTAADVSALQRPIVALLDEIILNSQWEHGQTWSSEPLGLKYCGVLHLGSDFFDDIARLRRLGDASRELLRVYLLCILLGFEGQYRGTDPAHLRGIRENLARELGYGQATAKDFRLSPHAELGVTAPANGRRHPLQWRFIAAGAGFVLVMLAGLHIWLADIASNF